MSSALKDQITADMKDAMRAKDSVRLGAIRMLLAAVKQREVDERIEPTDAIVLAIIEKSVKQRKDSITQFTTANRQDLVDQETIELKVLEAYMPAQMSDAEITAAVAAAIEQTGATGTQDMGKLMGVLKPALAGKADMAKVNVAVKAAFA